MIDAKLFLCADSAAIDVRMNAMSAFHILEQLNVPSFPVAIPRISVLASLTRENSDPSNIQVQLQIEIAGQQLFAGPMPFNFMQQLSARSILDMQGLLVTSPGNLIFTMSHEGRSLASWTIQVHQVGRTPVQMYIPGVQSRTPN
jgi:hypothetical protein